MLFYHILLSFCCYPTTEFYFTLSHIRRFCAFVNCSFFSTLDDDEVSGQKMKNTEHLKSIPNETQKNYGLYNFKNWRFGFNEIVFMYVCKKNYIANMLNTL